jgi:hypothetical protein
MFCEKGAGEKCGSVTNRQEYAPTTLPSHLLALLTAPSPRAIILSCTHRIFSNLVVIVVVCSYHFALCLGYLPPHFPDRQPVIGGEVVPLLHVLWLIASDGGTSIEPGPEHSVFHSDRRPAVWPRPDQ